MIELGREVRRSQAPSRPSVLPVLGELMGVDSKTHRAVP
jgi:hypothetical protein